MADGAPYYLIRWLYGRRRPEVYRVRPDRQFPIRQRWRFDHGIAVVDDSLSDALLCAQSMLPAVHE
jgi:hypothetical protein